jgi:hypothetical protein
MRNLPCAKANIMAPFRVAAMALLLFAFETASASENEISLFDGQGRATAYIAVSDDLTIYLWSGEPVAYMVSDSSDGYDVYGFNGKHLGWFLKGIVWDHSGGASCAVKDAIQFAQLEPLKSLKQLKPLKGLKELRPIRPVLSNAFGDTPCVLLLGSGAS